MYRSELPIQDGHLSLSTLCNPKRTNIELKCDVIVAESLPQHIRLKANEKA